MIKFVPISNLRPVVLFVLVTYWLSLILLINFTIPIGIYHNHYRNALNEKIVNNSNIFQLSNSLLDLCQLFVAIPIKRAKTTRICIIHRLYLHWWTRTERRRLNAFVKLHCHYSLLMTIDSVHNSDLLFDMYCNRNKHC